MTNTVQQATEDSNRLDARRLLIWPIAILVSFPIGGYLADLVVDGVDSVGAALLGGLIAGLVTRDLVRHCEQRSRPIR